MKYSIIERQSTVFASFSKAINCVNLIQFLEKIEGVTAHASKIEENELIITRKPYVTINDIRMAIEYHLTSFLEEFEYVEAYS